MKSIAKQNPFEMKCSNIMQTMYAGNQQNSKNSAKSFTVSVMCNKRALGKIQSALKHQFS